MGYPNEMVDVCRRKVLTVRQSEEVAEQNVAQMIRVCTKCKIEKPLSEFPKNKASRDGRHTTCSPCKRAYEKEVYDRDPEHARKLRRRRRQKHLYGITQEFFDLAFASQRGLCAICKKQLVLDHTSNHQANKAHVDHDHATQKFRGLLCGYCNLGLGKFWDNPSLLREAAAYLDFHAGNDPLIVREDDEER